VRGHVPIRTCVGCGRRDPQPTLIRFVATPAVGRSLPGRGAYLHRHKECWKAFARARGPVRSLRATPTPAEREKLVAMLTAEN
jgi:uncharacterized protein